MSYTLVLGFSHANGVFKPLDPAYALPTGVRVGVRVRIRIRVSLVRDGMRYDIGHEVRYVIRHGTRLN